MLPGAAGSYGLIHEVSDNEGEEEKEEEEEEEEGEEREEEDDEHMVASDIDDIAIPRAVRAAAREVLELDTDPRSLRRMTSSAAATPAVSAHSSSRKQGIYFCFICCFFLVYYITFSYFLTVFPLIEFIYKCNFL